MRMITPAIAALLLAWLGSPVLSQPLSDLQTRHMRACIADGDSEAFCKCEFDVTKDGLPQKDFALLLDLTEADQASRVRIASEIGQDELRRLMAKAEELSKQAEASCRAANPRPAAR